LSNDLLNITITATDLKNVSLSLQPIKNDDTILRRNISIQVARILCTRMNFFGECFKDLIHWHIQHQFSKQANEKSVVVSLNYH
jgi:hypothetical protein